jgi:hypothetical protein
LNVSLNSNSDSFIPLNVNSPLSIYALNTNLLTTSSQVSNIRTQNFTDTTFDLSWDPVIGAENYIVTIRRPDYKSVTLSGYNNQIVGGTYYRITGYESVIGTPAPRYDIDIKPISGLITGKSAFSYTYGKIHPPLVCVFPSDTTANVEWSAVIPLSTDKLQSIILKGPNGTILGHIKKDFFLNF